MYIKELLLEELYGNNLTVYHRTSVTNLLDKVYEEGWVVGNKKYNGAGFYGCLDLESQQQPGMKNNYGPLIAKFLVYTKNFLILDYELFKLSPNFKNIGAVKDNYILKQFIFFDVRFSNESDWATLLAMAKAANETDFTSNIVDRFWVNFYKKCDGVIFKKRNGQYIVICYNLSMLIPVSYSEDEGQTWLKPTNVNLKRIKSATDQKYLKTLDITNQDKHHPEINKHGDQIGPVNNRNKVKKFINGRLSNEDN